jgi:hypothetical protein
MLTVVYSSAVYNGEFMEPSFLRKLLFALTLLAWVVGALVAVAECLPATVLAQAVAQVLPLAEPRLKFAERVATDARLQAQLPRAELEADTALALAPQRLRATLTKLDVEVARNGGHINARSLELVEQSYALSPLEYTYGFSRLTFLYNHWGELSPRVRRMVYREAECLDAADHLDFEAINGKVYDRLGAFAAFLIQQQAGRQKSLCMPPSE